MSTEPSPITRKARHLRVPVLPSEADEIKRLATAAGLPVAAYLRSVGLGYRLCNALDHSKIDELLRINGDLGRLGGLLKLWLTDDARTARFGEATIRAVLSKIEDTQSDMRQVIRALVQPTSKRPKF